MKFLFIENRGKTAFWQHVAGELHRHGHDIAWLVQNPQYVPHAPDGVAVHVLPFPPAGTSDGASAEDSWVARHYPALVTDRGRRYFKGGEAHYPHYSQQIESVLRQESPDVVVGEATLFHELIAIDVCRRLAIPYVHPGANRYPSGRFSMYASETQVPLVGSGEQWDEAKAREQAERIATGREVPFYMVAPGRFEKVQQRIGQVLAHATVLLGRLQGERFNTPALFRKLALGRQLKRHLLRWQELQKLPSSASRTLLYPLQMQPESNIDVWGAPYSDQLAVVRAMLEAAPSDVQIAVKANPKSKYEVCAELLALAEKEPRICLLPLAMRMPEAQRFALGVLTISGTVGLEAVLGKGRCISLRHPIIEKHFPEFHATSIEHGVWRLLNEPDAGIGRIDTGTVLIQELVKESFPGLVSEPLYHPMCIDPNNVSLVADALFRVACANLTNQKVA